MSEQKIFDFDPPIVIPVTSIADPVERFHAFHRQNPAVLQAIVRIAKQQKSAGWKKGSINMIFERLRWLHAIRTQGDAYALNNNYRAYYARVTMALVPELDGFFEVRGQTSLESTYKPDWKALGFELEPARQLES